MEEEEVGAEGDGEEDEGGDGEDHEACGQDHGKQIFFAQACPYPLPSVF